MRINICDLFNFVPESESVQQCHIFPIIIIIISSLHFREMRLFVTVGTTKVKLTRAVCLLSLTTPLTV